jgi:RNA polymerase sigma-70 factor (ECF subfamily)
MTEDDRDPRLCSISTLWSVVLRAHDDQPEAARAAQRQLLERYGPAVRRYLLCCLPDEESAEELYQEFILRFLSGDFRKADPSKGRFRNYLKTVIYHMLCGHRRQNQNRPVALRPDVADPAVEQPLEQAMDATFLESWRKELLDRCWAALARAEQQGGQPYDTVLRVRADNPEVRSPQLAELVSARLGRPLSATAVRQALHRARERFAELLVEEVRQSLVDPDKETLIDELIDLGLYQHCEAVLKKRRS